MIKWRRKEWAEHVERLEDEGKLEGINNLVDLGLNWRMRLKWILRKKYVEDSDWIRLPQDRLL
jgi:hypothetical protein